MGEQEPEAEDRLGEHVKDSIGDDFAVDADVAGSVGNTPNTTVGVSVGWFRLEIQDLHWVESPEDESETSNGLEESAGLRVLGHCHSTAVNGELVDNDEVGGASHGVVSPLSSLIGAEGSEEAGKDHDEIGHDGDENAGAIQARKEGKIQK